MNNKMRADPSSSIFLFALLLFFFVETGGIFTSPVDSLGGSLGGRTFHASLLAPLLLDVTLFIYLLMYFLRALRSWSCYHMEDRLGKWNLASSQPSWFRSHGPRSLSLSLFLSKNLKCLRTPRRRRRRRRSPPEFFPLERSGGGTGKSLFEIVTR